MVPFGAIYIFTWNEVSSNVARINPAGVQVYAPYAVLDFFFSLSLTAWLLLHPHSKVSARTSAGTQHCSHNLLYSMWVSGQLIQGAAPPSSAARRRATRLTCNAASFPPKFEENFLNLPGFFRWKVHRDWAWPRALWNERKISHKLMEYLLCQSVVIFLRTLTYPFIDWPSACSQSLGNSCVFFFSTQLYTESVLTLKANQHSGTSLVEYPLLPTVFFNLNHCSTSISANSVNHAQANKMHKGEMMQAQRGEKDTLSSFRSFEFDISFGSIRLFRNEFLLSVR